MSLDEAAHVPIFTRGPSAKPPTQSNTLTHAFTEMATSILRQHYNNRLTNHLLPLDHHLHLAEWLRYVESILVN